jgi:hypothetical protein
VTTMGGRIWAKPRPEGGAEFGFSLPTYPDEPEPIIEEASGQQSAVTTLESKAAAPA